MKEEMRRLVKKRWMEERVRRKRNKETKLWIGDEGKLDERRD